MTHEETTTEIPIPGYTPSNPPRNVVRVKFPKSHPVAKTKQDPTTIWVLRLLAVVTIMFLSLLVL